MSINSPGVYVCRNTVTGKVYVGSSLTPRIRIASHIRNLTKNRHVNEHLQRAWNKTGSLHFVWEVIEACPRKDLRAREQCWIENLHANEPNYGYNKAYPVRGRIPSGRMTKVHKAYWDNLESDEYGKRVVHLTDSERNPKIISKVMTEKWKDPEFREARLAGLTRGRNKTNSVVTDVARIILTTGRAKAIERNKSPEGRAAQRMNNLAQWQDPKIREARLASLARGRQVQAERKQLRLAKLGSQAVTVC